VKCLEAFSSPRQGDRGAAWAGTRWPVPFQHSQTIALLLLLLEAL